MERFQVREGAFRIGRDGIQHRPGQIVEISREEAASLPQIYEPAPPSEPKSGAIQVPVGHRAMRSPRPTNRGK